MHRSKDTLTPEKLNLSIREASQASGIGRTKIYDALRLGELESLKIGKRRLIPQDALRDWLARFRLPAA